MQVLYDEDLASHIGPEPCVMFREEHGEASAGECVGWPSSRESTVSASNTQGGSRMREFRPYGSVRGAPSNGRPYRDFGIAPNRQIAGVPRSKRARNLNREDTSALGDRPEERVQVPYDER